jgi:hypothetical protein
MMCLLIPPHGLRPQGGRCWRGGRGLCHDPSREGRAIIRLKQMTFVSQVKLVLLLALPTGAMIFILFLAMALAGFFNNRPQDDAPFWMIVPILAVFSGICAAMVAITQIAALGLLRLLPWRGPELKVEEPRNLSGIFE